MARDPRSRDELRRRLDEALGPEAASTLMEALPPRPWNELATKDDIAALKGDVVALKVDVAAVKADIVALEVRVENRFDSLEERMSLRLDALKYEITAAFRAELNSAITSQTRAMLLSTFGTVVGVGSLVLAAAAIA